MALMNCPECSKRISDLAPACTGCGAPIAAGTDDQAQPKSPAFTKLAVSVHLYWYKALAVSVVAIAALSFVVIRKSSVEEMRSTDLDWKQALVMCQFALKKISLDPDKADIPHVPNHGSGDEFYFAWGSSTKMARMRNGLGLDVATTASCIGSKSQKRITSLTLNGETIL